VRGGDNRTGELFSYVDLEAHPVRAIRTIVNEALSAPEREFAGSSRRLGGRRSRRRSCCGRCCCRLGAPSHGAVGNLLLRWFVGIGVDDAAWDYSVFWKNRDWLLEGDIVAKFLAAVLAQPQ
jgi:hypothetical protein